MSSSRVTMDANTHQILFRRVPQKILIRTRRLHCVRFFFDVLMISTYVSGTLQTWTKLTYFKFYFLEGPSMKLLLLNARKIKHNNFLFSSRDDKKRIWNVIWRIIGSIINRKNLLNISGWNRQHFITYWKSQKFSITVMCSRIQAVRIRIHSNRLTRKIYIKMW